MPYKINNMLPPWLAYPYAEQRDPGFWRLGRGEQYLDEYSDWITSLPTAERRATLLKARPIPSMWPEYYAELFAYPHLAGLATAVALQWMEEGAGEPIEDVFRITAPWRKHPAQERASSFWSAEGREHLLLYSEWLAELSLNERRKALLNERPVPDEWVEYVADLLAFPATTEAVKKKAVMWILTGQGPSLDS